MEKVCNFNKEKKERLKYADIIARATMMGIMEEVEYNDRRMDIESADVKFNLRLDDWLKADDSDFVNDFIGIRNSVDRENGFPAKDFGSFVPKFAGVD